MFKFYKLLLSFIRQLYQLTQLGQLVKFKLWELLKEIHLFHTSLQYLNRLTGIFLQMMMMRSIFLMLNCKQLCKLCQSSSTNYSRSS